MLAAGLESATGFHRTDSLENAIPLLVDPRLLPGRYRFYLNLCP
jgi:hypothetical protein